MYIHKDKIGYTSGANASDLPNALNMKKKNSAIKNGPNQLVFWRFNNASRYLIVGKPQQGKSEQKF